MRAGASTLALLVVSALGVDWQAAPAHAATERVIEGDVIRLISIEDPQAMARLTPGAVETWIVGVQAETREPGTISVELEASGADAVLSVDVRSCAVRWTSSGCAAGESIDALRWTAANGSVLRLGEVSTDEQRWIRFDVSLRAGVERAEGSRVALAVVAEGAGERATTAQGTRTLPQTGAATALLPWVAAGALIVGILLMVSSRGRTGRSP